MRSGQTVGNQYAKYFADAADAAFANTPPASRSAALAEIVGNFAKSHHVFYGSDLPSWLSEQLVNSVSHIRSAMWFSTCAHCHKSNDTRLKDRGFWRQWEAFDCPDIDSIHSEYIFAIANDAVFSPSTHFCLPIRRRRAPRAVY